MFPESKEPPRFITYLGTVLPYAMTGLLVVYSLKGVHLTSGSHGIPELLAIIAIALLHIWKRNMLLSIAGGTAVYMLLVQLVFLLRRLPPVLGIAITWRAPSRI